MIKETNTTKKMYILDTNVLIHDPKSLFSFEGAHVGIPITVLEELDVFKNESSQRGRNARESIRFLDMVRERGCISEGVTLDNGGMLHVLLMPEEDRLSIALDMSVKDNQILWIAVVQKERGYTIHFISKDLNMRVKADALRLDAFDYLTETSDEDTFYQGWIKAHVPAADLKKEQPGVLKELQEEHTFSYNEFALLESQSNPENYKLYRYIGNDIFHPVTAPNLDWPLGPRNPQQLMACDLLFDPSIQFVSLVGQAGTGKTFLTLLAALYQILVEDAYEKLLVTRPVIPLGKDIGYLPGDIQEKMYSWMQPVRDNMEFIVRRANSNYDMSIARDEEKSMKKKDKKRPKRRTERVNVPSLDQLVAAEKISLEAITYMRGRSIPYQFIVIDEVQNLTPHEVKTLISRVGEGSKVIIAGDPYQIDSPYLDFNSNGLIVASERFQGQMIFGSVYLEVSERSLLSQLAGELL
jgi:PhoH-like ATPase